MLDTRLKIFQMAALHRNFTRAAAALGMSQPNVTGQIRRLEEELGVELFVRDGRTLSLSHAGEVLLKSADALLELSENTVRMVRNAASESRLLRLGATLTAGGYVLPHLAVDYMRRYRNVRLELTVANTEEIADRLKKHFLDLALVEGPFDERFFLAEQLLSDELLVAGSPELPIFRRGEPVGCAELVRSGLPLLLREKGSGTRFHFDAFARRYGVVPGEAAGGILELNSPEAIKGMIRTGFGVTVISELAIRDELAAGTLAALRFREGMLRRAMNFIYLPNGALRFCEEFVTSCRRFVRAGAGVPGQDLSGDAF